jgi:exonuclease SbcD
MVLIRLDVGVCGRKLLEQLIPIASSRRSPNRFLIHRGTPYPALPSLGDRSEVRPLHGPDPDRVMPKGRVHSRRVGTKNAKFQMPRRPMDQLTFLQFSDLHFESREHVRQWRCSPEKEQILERETREVVSGVVTLAKERQVDVVLIAGDLYDEQTMSLDGLRFLQDCFQSLGKIPVFIAPGNDDPYRPSSFYNSEFLKAIGLKPWPPNVHVFTGMPFSRVLLPGQRKIAITGVPHVGRDFSQERAFSILKTDNSEGLNILVFHGTCERNGSPEEGAIMPFTADELLSHRFDYVAFGHVPEGQEIIDEAGRIRGAAAGCPCGRRLNEAGEKTVIVGQMEKGGVQRENMERIRLALRTVHEVTVSCRGVKQLQSLHQRIERALSRGGIEAMDLVSIRLQGQANRDHLREIYEDSLKDMYFLIRLDTSGVRSPFDFRKYARGGDTGLTTEGLYIREMKTLLDKARSDEEKKTIEKTLQLGLDALRNKSIEFDHEIQEA